jgi:hypothetical protein
LLKGLLASEDFHPGDSTLPAIGAFHGGVEYSHGCAPDIRSGAIAFHERDNWTVGNL